MTKVDFLRKILDDASKQTLTDKIKEFESLCDSLDLKSKEEYEEAQKELETLFMKLMSASSSSSSDSSSSNSKYSKSEETEEADPDFKPHIEEID